MREKMEMKTDTLGVIASTAWPMLLAWLVVAILVLLLLPLYAGWPIIALMGVMVLLTFLICVRMYFGVYIFMPATEYKGPRIIARLGRNETEIGNVIASDIIVKQGWIERMFHVCHIRQKDTGVYLRGVKDMEKVQAWIDANFPKERKAAPVKSKKAKK